MANVSRAKAIWNCSERWAAICRRRSVKLHFLSQQFNWHAVVHPIIFTLCTPLCCESGAPICRATIPSHLTSGGCVSAGRQAWQYRLLTLIDTLLSVLLALPLRTLANRVPHQQLMLWSELLRLLALLVMLGEPSTARICR